MFDTKRERKERYEQSLAMLKLSHGSDATIDPEVNAIMLEWVENGGNFEDYEKRIEEIEKAKYGE